MSYKRQLFSLAACFVVAVGSKYTVCQDVAKENEKVQCQGQTCATITGTIDDRKLPPRKDRPFRIALHPAYGESDTVIVAGAGQTFALPPQKPGSYVMSVSGYTNECLVDGTLTATGNAVVNVQGGSLLGGGTINGNVLMGGTMQPGSFTAPGTLTVNGNYEQTGTGVYNELISQTTNGLSEISGSAMFDPGASLDIHLLGGFDPSNGMSFIIMDYSSESGTLTITDPIFNGATQQWVITSYAGGVGGHGIVLTAEPFVAPEPNTLLLFGTGLLSLVGWVRMKNKCRGISMLGC